MDNSLINQIADIEAIKKNLQTVVDLATKTAENLGKTFKNSVDLNFSDAEKGAKALENLTNTVKKGKQQLSDYSKAQENLAKAQANTGIASEKIAETIAMQAKSVAELTAKNKVLEAIKKNLNSTDSDYLSNIAKINEAQNANNQAIAETNNLEQKRTSGIGKYKEAIEEALGKQTEQTTIVEKYAVAVRTAMDSSENYKTQLLELRNTMADLEIAINAGKDSTGELAQQYDLLEQKAGEVADAQGDMQARIKYLADDYGKFKAVLAGVQAAMGIASAFKGFTSLLGIHSEEVERVTAKMTALIATMQGLKEVQELLDKDNYFIQFLKQQKQAIADIATKMKEATTATEKYKIATEGLKTSLGGLLKVFSGGNVIVMAFMAAITGAVIMIKDVIKGQKELNKRLKEEQATREEIARLMANEETDRVKKIKRITAQAIVDSISNIDFEKAAQAIKKRADGSIDMSDFGNSFVEANEIAIAQISEALREALSVNIAKVSNEISKLQLQENLSGSTEETRRQLGELRALMAEYQSKAKNLNKEASTFVQNSDFRNFLASLTKIPKNINVEVDTDEAVKEVLNENKKTIDISINVEEEDEAFISTLMSRRQFQSKFDFKVNPISFKETMELIDIWDGVPDKIEEKTKKTLSILEAFSRKMSKNIMQNIEGRTIEDVVMISDAVFDLTKTIGNQLNTVLSDVLQNAIKINEKEMELQEEKITRETENAKIVAKERIQDEQMLALELERIDILADQKKKKLLNEQAKRNFIAEQANFALQALVAFASAVAFTPGEVAVKLIAGGIAAAAVGAEALAHAAKGVPKYEKGGEAVANQPFIAGEAGAEIGIGKSGKLYNFDREKLYMANENIKIFNHADSERLKPKLIENHTFTHDKAVNITVTRDYITDDRQQYVNKYLKIRK